MPSSSIYMDVLVLQWNKNVVPKLHLCVLPTQLVWLHFFLSGVCPNNMKTTWSEDKRFLYEQAPLSSSETMEWAYENLNIFAWDRYGLWKKENTKLQKSKGKNTQAHDQEVESFVDYFGIWNFGAIFSASVFSNGRHMFVCWGCELRKRTERGVGVWERRRKEGVGFHWGKKKRLAVEWEREREGGC